MSTGHKHAKHTCAPISLSSSSASAFSHTTWYALASAFSFYKSPHKLTLPQRALASLLTSRVTLKIVPIVSCSHCGRSRCAFCCVFFFAGAGLGTAGTSAGRFSQEDGGSFMGVAAGTAVGVDGPADGGFEAAGAGVGAGLGVLDTAPCSFARRFSRIYKDDKYPFLEICSRRRTHTLSIVLRVCSHVQSVCKRAR